MEHTAINHQVYEALVCGFVSMDKSDWHTFRIDEYVGLIAVQKYPAAFEDGYRLAIDVAMINSADSQSDYRRDIAGYERQAKIINDKYGKIVVVDDDYAEGERKAYGFIGCRNYPFASIAKTTYNKDGKRETIIEHPRKEIEAEDAMMRRTYNYPKATIL